jgi:hypothetical protein
MFSLMFLAMVIGVVIDSEDTTTQQVANDKARTIARYGQPWHIKKQGDGLERWAYKNKWTDSLLVFHFHNGWLIEEEVLLNPVIY